MNYKKFLEAASAALMIVIVVTLVLAPAAGAASRYKVLHRFNVGANHGPEAGLILDAAGNLYGTTDSDGASNAGTAFKLTPNADGSWTESVLHSFNGSSDGWRPDAALIFDAAGNLYGTTIGGVATGAGTVFKLTPNADGSWTESALHSFNGSDGTHPDGGLIIDAAGNLYGTTVGDDFWDGTVFKLTPNADGSWTESVLHSFNGGEGQSSCAPLIFDAAGNLYGTTVAGGASNNGTVFKLTPNADGSWTESVLHSFNGSGDGWNPRAGLIFDAAGNLYGTTFYGGGCGGQGAASSSSSPRTPTEAGREACCTRSTAATERIPLPASSSMHSEISTARPTGAALLATARSSSSPRTPAAAGGTV